MPVIGVYAIFVGVNIASAITTLKVVEAVQNPKLYRRIRERCQDVKSWIE